MIKSHEREEYLAVFLVLLVCSFYSSYFGFLSQDSWKYIYLVQSIEEGKFCSINNKYFAVFPCGYPFIISIFNFSTNIETIIITSKFVNFILIFASYLILKKIFYSKSPIPILIILSPITLKISLSTWSENLFLFSTILTLFFIKKVDQNDKNLFKLILLFSLVLGISSRYFFVPFSILIFFSAIFVYGKIIIPRILPSFLLSGIFFLFYFILNYKITGYGFGMERIQSPENIVYLLVIFFKSSLPQLTSILIVILFFHFFSNTKIKKINFKGLFIDKNILMLFLTGTSFLTLSLILRLHTQFDLFGTRTLGYGFVFIVVTLYVSLIKLSDFKKKFIILFLLGCLSLAGSVSKYLFTQLSFILSNDNSSLNFLFFNQLNEYKTRSNVKDYKNVIALSIPPVSQLISSNPNYYYGKDTNFYMPPAIPYFKPIALKDFINYLSQIKGSCVIDFSEFTSIKDLEKKMNTKYRVNYNFKNLNEKYIEIPVYRGDFSKFIINLFNNQNKKIIKCEDAKKYYYRILKQN